MPAQPTAESRSWRTEAVKFLMLLIASPARATAHSAAATNVPVTGVVAQLRRRKNNGHRIRAVPGTRWAGPGAAGDRHASPS
jgi:hypothetical protein